MDFYFISHTSPGVTPPDAPPLPPDVILDQFKIFRSYIEHQHELINFRISWTLTIQGLLFAAYSYSAQKFAEFAVAAASAAAAANTRGAPIAIESLTPAIRILSLLVRQTLPLVGLAIGVIAFLGIVAAMWAVFRLERDWKRRFPAPSTPYVPPIGGGGSDAASFVGLSVSALIPLVFVAVWGYLWFTFHAVAL